MPLEIVKDISQQTIAIRQSSGSTGDTTKFTNPAAEAIQLGRRYQLTAQLGAKPVTAHSFSNASWSVLGNVQACESVDYSAKSGKVIPARLDAFPLNVSFGPATAKPFLRPINVRLTGLNKVNDAVWAAPEPFESGSVLTGAPPAESVSEHVDHYGTNVKAVFDESDGEWKIGMQNSSGNQGFGVTWTVSSLSKLPGSFFTIQLAKVKTDSLDTESVYCFDGQKYPHARVVSTPEQKNVSLDFRHHPGLRIKPQQELTGIVHSFSAKYLTYLFYQDDSPGSIPFLLDFPLTWGVSFKARYVNEASNVKGSIAITDEKIEPLAKAKSMSLPQWSSNITSTSLQSTSTPQKPAQKTGSPTISRSVTVEFRNRSDAFLSRSSYELEHGTWAKSLSPPEQIGAGSRDMPVTISWAAEAQGQAGGVEGGASYLLQDGQTRLYMSWNNPKTAGNSYGIYLSGPLASKYRCTWGAGAGDDAHPYFLLMSVD